LKNSLSGAITDDIKWNFTKFLIDKTGNPIKRYGSNVKPADLEADIVETLKAKN
jgi:glutathione peroxidase